MLEILEDQSHIYFIMELIEHGNLLEVMERISSNGWRFNDKDAANMIKQILLALNYMHKQGVIHRDLKLENVMVDVEISEDGNAELVCKLTDFGFACVLDNDRKASQKLGTVVYMAPEIFMDEKYDEKVDTWALGVLTYVMLTG